LTRIIVYVLRTSEALCTDALERLESPTIELRYISNTERMQLHTHSSGTGEEWIGVGLGDKMKLIADVAEEEEDSARVGGAGGLIMWVDPDREVGSGVMRVWEEVAREGVWVGRSPEEHAEGRV
jgi:hypothetical protein